MNKPLWSVTIPSYNASEYIGATIKSVLDEKIAEERLEIMVIDNCSTDNTKEVVEKVGEGRVKFLVNEKNLGPHGNFNRCIERASGKYVHMLHADDLVKNGFYSEFERSFDTSNETFIAFCKAELIDENGKITGESKPVMSLGKPSHNISELLYSNPICTPAVVVKKEAYQKLGNFDTDFIHVADWEMWVRIIKNLGGIYIDKTLCQYRIHSTNDTSKLLLTGNNILDYENLYRKFEKLGYPIEAQKYRRELRFAAERQYLHFKNKGNSEAANNALKVLSRYSSFLKVFYFLIRNKIVPR